MRRLSLVVILIIAAVLRLAVLSTSPAGFNADEAALGYNAYSLLTTGKDEHGHPWPINLESFGDFKPALYAYLLIPFIKIFGLTELAVRLPSALAGIAAVGLMYLLAKEIFSNWDLGNYLEIRNSKLEIADAAALLLAISPWHLHFSRGAWEVNLATTLILAGVYLFLRYLKNSRFLILELSALSFALSMYTYQSARIIAPLLGVGLALLYFKQLIRRPKHLFLGLLTVAVTVTPLVISLVRSDAASRLSGVGLLADEGPLNRVRELRGQHPLSLNLLGRFLHNRPVIYTIEFIGNYSDHFSGDFLFINGDTIPRNRIPETGLLYLTDFILLVLGIFYLVRHPGSHTRIIWLWFFIAPVAAALTFQTPHALRSQNLIIPLTIINASGLYALINYLRNLKIRYWILFGIWCLVLSAYIWQVSRYLHQYYVHYPKEYPSAWEYGFRELVAYVVANQDRYQQILITDKYDQPYILFLFYSRYSPSAFQNDHQLTFRDKYNFSTVRNFGKYQFTSTPWAKVRDIHGTLIVAAPEDIPEDGVHVVKTINFPDGSPAFKIISN